MKSVGFFEIFSLLFLLCLPFSCEKGYRVEEDRSREPGASVRINNLSREAVTAEGLLEWRLKAADAYLFRSNGSGESKIIVYGFNMEQFDRDRGSLGVVTGDRGEVDYANRVIHLTGNVAFNDGTGKSVTGGKMDYNMEEKMLVSDSPVVLTDSGVITHCRKGIIIDKEKGQQICKSPAGTARKVPEQMGGSSSGRVEGLFQ